MVAIGRITMLVGIVMLSACVSTFNHTWKDPAATPLEFKGEKVAAVVLVKDDAMRRLAEDRLAQQIAARGAQGRAMYSLLPGATSGNEQAVRAALEAANVKGVIVMRPVNVDKKVKVRTTYDEPSYASFWGGYYGYGFAMSYSSSSGPRTTVSEDTVVYVETLVYSHKQNKLVWGGQSKTTNPDTLTELIQDLVAATTKELDGEVLINK